MYSALLQTDLETEGIVCDNGDHIRHTNGRQGIDNHKLFDDQGLLIDERGRKADGRL
jgi:hypothetical protein